MASSVHIITCGSAPLFVKRFREAPSAAGHCGPFVLCCESFPASICNLSLAESMFASIACIFESGVCTRATTAVSAPNMHLASNQTTPLVLPVYERSRGFALSLVTSSVRIGTRGSSLLFTVPSNFSCVSCSTSVPPHLAVAIGAQSPPLFVCPSPFAMLVCFSPRTLAFAAPHSQRPTRRKTRTRPCDVVLDVISDLSRCSQANACLRVDPWHYLESGFSAVLISYPPTASRASSRLCRLCRCTLTPSTLVDSTLVDSSRFCDCLPLRSV
jgi:hypothetical protein